MSRPLSGPNARVTPPKRSVVWMVVAVAATLVVLATLATQCAPATSPGEIEITPEARSAVLAA